MMMLKISERDGVASDPLVHLDLAVEILKSILAESGSTSLVSACRFMTNDRRRLAQSFGVFLEQAEFAGK